MENSQSQWAVDYNNTVFTVSITYKPKDINLLKYMLLVALMKDNRLPNEFNYEWNGFTLVINKRRFYRFRQIN